MAKLTFKDTQFLKLITDNIRFMEKLERISGKVKRPNEFIYVPMNKISDQEQIKDIKNIQQLLELPKELITHSKFRFKLIYRCLELSDNRVNHFINCPLTLSLLTSFEIEESDLLFVKVEYQLKYDSAGEENQRRWDKQNKKDN